jgi:glycosyltransferase involved in cell wall biosynthesis
MNEGAISVVIPYSPAHTPEKMLNEAKESIRAQSFPSKNIIIVKDKDQKGPAWARNQGIKRAKTRYVAFNDADDLWHPTKLERQLSQMEHTGAGICVEGEQLSVKEFVRGLLNGDLGSLTPSILIDTEQVDVRFSESLHRREDHLFMIQAAEQAGICFCENLTTIRKHEKGLSAQNSLELRETVIEEFDAAIREETEIGAQYLDYMWAEYYHRRGRAFHRKEQYRDAIRELLLSLRTRPRIKTMGALAVSSAGLFANL